VTSSAQTRAPRIRNRRTQALSRRESFWQILFPMGLVLVAALTLMALIVVGTVAGSLAPVQTSAFADVSLMLLILIAGTGSLLILALAVGLCVGVGLALRELPYLFKRAQDFAALVAYHTRRVTAPLNESVLSVRSVLAAARQAVISIRTILTFGR
jgi:hypothetical protein